MNTKKIILLITIVVGVVSNFFAMDFSNFFRGSFGRRKIACEEKYHEKIVRELKNRKGPDEYFSPTVEYGKNKFYKSLSEN